MSDEMTVRKNYIEGGRQYGRWRAERGPPMDPAQATPGSYGEPRLSPLDRIAVPEPTFAWDRDMRIGGRDFAARDQRLRVLVIGALSAAVGLGLIGGFQLLFVAPGPTAIEHKKCSDHAADADETSCVAAKSDRQPMLGTPNLQTTAGPSAITGRSKYEPSQSIDPRTAAPTKTATPAMRESATSPGRRAAATQQANSLRPAPVPETKPGTLEGWTVRDVAGGTVLLQGPNGEWRATRGDTVPGLGKVDSIVRWGNRWIVATDRGLVSTP